MPPERPAGRSLALMLGGALLALGLLLHSSATALPGAPGHLLPADTNGADTSGAPADTLRPDSLAADTIGAPADTSTRLVRRYLPPRRAPRSAELLPPRRAFLRGPLGPETRLTADSLGQAYTARERVGNLEVRPPLTVDRATYRRLRQRRDLDANWRALSDERQRRRQQQRRGGLGVSVAVPGGRSSAFSTVFGAPQVDLRVTGQADIQAGFDYRKSDQQTIASGDPTQLDPDFQQDLRLGITGTVGDKMQVDVNWDTQSQFEYQNQVKLEYTGYEDEIIQRIEAGNVFLETPSSLIRGGQSLFGIKSELQLGPVRLTTVASQQEGQSNSLSIEGGSETQSFSAQPIEYDEDQHFFLGYYFRNRWEEAHSTPPTPQLADGFSRITDIDVWKLRTTSTTNADDVRQVSAVVDLGEDEEILSQAGAYTDEVLPDPGVDQYDAAALDDLRDPNVEAQFVQSQFGLTSSEYEGGPFQRLEGGPDGDYVFDDRFGYLSLKQPLQDSEALAVAFRYEAQGGAVIEVGDLGADGGDSDAQTARRIVLKLLRPSNLTQPTASNPAAAWYLMMRNIYSLRGRNFDQDNFDLRLYYDPPSQPQQSDLGGRQLLNLLGLDRIGPNGQSTPDDVFDFINGYTIDAGEGRIIFPYLQPFGQRIEDETGDASLAFNNLYLQKKESARNDGRADLYRITGQYQGGAQGFYDLQAISGLVDGSVNVTAGGQTLAEGADYTVDYQGGTVNITNQDYLSAGRSIDITYEQNALFNIQQKTLLGARATYAPGDRFALGTTVMRLSESSPVDKFRIGEEPIQNTIIGLDGTLDLEPRWLTRAVDALPLVQTRAPSALSIAGEVAQLRPGHSNTDAFRRTRDGLQDDGLDFRSDELGGISYIDDFEGFENTFSLTSQLQSWKLSAPPAAAEDSVQSPVARSLRRGLLGWYQISRGIRERIGDAATNPDDEAVQLVDVRDVFPGRDLEGAADNKITTFDLYFDPQARGPYNYTPDLDGFVARPEENWGGLTQRLPEGYRDFSLQNVEFVEFIFRPFTGAATDSAALYLDLGTISEDVVPNSRLNNEDGLSISSFSESAIDVEDDLVISRLPLSRSQNKAIDIEDGRTEDLGLDGLASYPEDAGDAGGLYGLATEQVQFGETFLSTLPLGGSGRLAAEVARARLDPSADDYHFYDDERFFGNTALFPGGATLQQRLAFLYSGQELNSYEAQNRIDAGSSQGNARTPDSEKLDFSNTVNTQDSYFRYRVPLDPDELNRLADPAETDDYIVEQIRDESERATGWYLVRIPVRMPTDSIGGLNGFSLIESMRLWTEGHRAPATLRFATLELVGSQWRESAEVFLSEETEVLPVTDESAGEAALTISSINSEENSLYQKPPRAIVSQNQSVRGTRQRAREQSLVLQGADIEPGEQRAIFKTNNGGYDLLRYSNLRMFTHLEGDVTGGALGARPEQERGLVTLFVRLGANQEADYYEYELPLTPSPIGASTAEALWLDENEVNIRLSDLNELKVARDNATADRTARASADSLNVDFDDARGERLFIKGNPSLQDVRTLVIGLRNGTGEETALTATTLEDVRVWVNELRTTGYDESNGWAALATADVQLADLGRVRANFQTQTDGFGALGSTLEEREQINRMNWGVQTELNADRLLPERYGWSLPVSVQVRSETATPRYAPSRGDVRLQEVLDQNEAREDLSEEERAREREEIIDAAQTHRLERSVTASIQKQGSDSRLLRNTLDALSLSYSYSDSDRRDPSQRTDNAWNWNSTASYRLSGLEPRTVRPLGLLGGVPLLGALGDLRLNLLPQSVTLSASARRGFTQRQTRSARLLEDALPERLREQQTFTHDRRFSLQHSPFEFLNLSFDTNTDQSLNAGDLSSTTRYQVFSADGDGGFDVEAFDTPEEAEDALRDLQDDDVEAFRQDDLELTSAPDVLRRIARGDGPRTDTYQQGFTATLRPSLLGGDALSWISLEDLTYQSTFRFRNGPIGQRTGAGASNDVGLRGGITFQPQELWRKFGFYRRLEEQQQAAGQEPPRRAPPPQGENAGDENGAEDADAEEDGGSFVGGLLRRAVLAATSVRDFSVTYSGNRSASSSNIGRTLEEGGIATDYTLIDAFSGNGPTLGYRFGLDRSIDADQRIFGDGTFQVTDLFSENNTVQARTALEPGRSLRIDVNWNTDWERGRNVTLTESTSRETFNGRNTSSVWAFGGSYLDLLERQLDRLEADFTGDEVIEDTNGDGLVALTNESLVRDFRDAFVGGPGTLDRRGLLAFPMPNWSVSYTGLSGLPLVRSVTQTVNLRHSYAAEFQNAYRSEALADSLNQFPIGGNVFRFERPAFETSSVEVAERYQPLAGLDINWKGGIQTNIAWNRTNLFELSTLNASLTTNRVNELEVTARFQKQGLKIPLLPLGRLENRVSLSVTFSRATNDELQYLVRSALSDALDGASGGTITYDPSDALEGEDNVSPQRETQRIAVTPKLSYQFSNRVSADLLLQYENFSSQTSTRPSYTNVNGGFNVRVSISN